MRSVCHTVAEFSVLNGGLSQYSRRLFLTPDIPGIPSRPSRKAVTGGGTPRNAPISTVALREPPGSVPPRVERVRRGEVFDITGEGEVTVRLRPGPVRSFPYEPGETAGQSVQGVSWNSA